MLGGGVIVPGALIQDAKQPTKLMCIISRNQAHSAVPRGVLLRRNPPTRSMLIKAHAKARQKTLMDLWTNAEFAFVP